MVILYSTRLRIVKHLIDRVLELQDDEAQSPKTPEFEEAPDLENLLKSLQPKIRVFGCGGCGSNTAGLGGGTGTGSAHVVARRAKAAEALTIAGVSYPFVSEGAVRRQNAEWGLERLREVCDTVIVLPNERLLEVEGVRDLPLDAAFRVADELLMRSISGVSEMIAKEGVVNLDFQDLRSVMENGGGVAMIGLGEATVDEGAEKATMEALQSPLLDIDFSDARGALVNVVGGPGLTLGEAEQCAKIIRESINPYAKMIWGVTTDDSMGSDIRVLLVLTGVKSEQIHGAALHTQMRNLRNRTVEFVS